MNGNIYLILNNGKKICVHLDENYASIFDPKDNEIDSDSFKFLLSFFGIDNNIIDICKLHNSKHKNFWHDGAPDYLSEDYIDKLLLMSNSKFAFQYLVDNTCTHQEIIQFFFKRKDYNKYSNMVTFISKSKNTFSLDHLDNEEYDYGHLYDKITYAIYWQRLLNPKPKVKNSKEEIILKKIKKLGGISKILKNKKILQILDTKLKEEYPNKK